MPPKVALLAFLCALLALIPLDRRWHRDVSVSSWIPVLWVLIIGSRPISAWLSPHAQLVGADSYTEGSPTDRAVFLLLIILGVVVLARRRVNWHDILSRNKWVIVFFGYFAISTLWSDYPFVSFKRWVKDFGNVVMVLVVITERNPVAATRAVLLRATYVLVPLSFVLVKYFPEWSRGYDRWTGQVFITGVTTDKNLLGMVLTATSLPVLWSLLVLWGQARSWDRTAQLVVLLALLAMIVWLLPVANSATAIICTSLGASVLILTRVAIVRQHARACAVLVLVAGLALLATGALSAIQEDLLGMLGRNATLTGRTEIWQAVLKEGSNPWLGVGFYSFWTGERVARLSAQYHYLLNEAHNGYLEVYLNGGVLALGLLLIFLWTIVGRSTSRLATETNASPEALSLAMVLVATVYGSTEAVFNRLDLIWFGLLLMGMDYARRLEEPVRIVRQDSGQRPHFRRPITKASRSTTGLGSMSPRSPADQRRRHSGPS